MDCKLIDPGNLRNAKLLQVALPRRCAKVAKIRRCAARLRAHDHRWRTLLPSSTGKCAPQMSGGDLELIINSRHGRLGIRVGSDFQALEMCAGIDDSSNRDSVAGLLFFDAMPDWICAYAAADPHWRLEVVSDPPLRPGTGLVLSHDQRTVQIVEANEMLMDAIERATATNRIELSPLLASVRLSGSIVVERRSVPLRGLRALQCGDVLLSRYLAASAVSEIFSGRDQELSWGSFALAHLRCFARLEGKLLILQTTPEVVPGAEESCEPSDQMGGGATTAIDSVTLLDTAPELLPVALENVQVPLIISLPVPAMSISEIAAMQPGVAIELSERPEDARVHISTNGQLVAVGRLVIVGDRLGVEILRVHAAYSEVRA